MTLSEEVVTCLCSNGELSFVLFTLVAGSFQIGLDAIVLRCVRAISTRDVSQRFLQEQPCGWSIRILLGLSTNRKTVRRIRLIVDDLNVFHRPSILWIAVVPKFNFPYVVKRIADSHVELI